MTATEHSGSQRRPVAAVIGSVRTDGAGEQVAQTLGQCLVDAGFRLVSGGLGGIMLAASRGARRSERYISGDVIGVLPTYDANTANEYVDIPICTGQNHGRNLIVVATGDVVFAVGGRSGTLGELALAWTLGKPVIAVGGVEGWGAELAGMCLDDRRQDEVHGPLPPAEAVALATELLRRHSYRPKGF